MSLLLLAYPELAKDNLESIQAYRKQYDLQYSFALPHFTIVFAVEDIPAKDFIEAVKKQSEGFVPFPFAVNKAVSYKDELSPLHYTFLVPAEGMGNIKMLHDNMYKGIFAPHLQPTVQYLPHITIGSAVDETISEKIVAVWNDTARPIHSTITTLDVVLYENKKLVTLERITLNK